MEHFYFLKQICETRSDVRHRQEAGVRIESERAQQQRGRLELVEKTSFDGGVFWWPARCRTFWGYFLSEIYHYLSREMQSFSNSPL